MLKKLVQIVRQHTARFRARRGSAGDRPAEIRRLLANGDVDGAWALCQAVKHGGELTHDLLLLEGGICGMRGRLEDARACLEGALSLNPESCQALADLGNIALAEHKLDEAQAYYDRAIAAHIDPRVLLNNRGQLEKLRGDSGKAETYFRAALAADVGNMTAFENLFALYDETEQYAKALALIDELLPETTRQGRLMHMRGFLYYKRLLNPRQADEDFDRAAESENGNPAFWVDRGICARDLGDGDRASAYFDRALALDEENVLAKFHKGLVSLYLQQYAVGWDAYEYRLNDIQWLGNSPPAKRWHGEALPPGSRLYLQSEQGLGDEIMFASCLRNIPDNLEVIAECSDKLMPIFKQSFPAFQWVCKGDILEDNDQSARSIPLGSLPQLFRRSLEQFPREAYLRTSDSARQTVKEKIAGLRGMRVGISWRGGTEITRGRLRSLPLEMVGKFSSLQGIDWINLQYGNCTEELHELRNRFGLKISHWPELIESYELTAALAAQVDLVLSVDTTIAHLAGALGQQVWVMTPAVPEWRYGYYASQMPWYAHVEIFRQKKHGCWDETVANVMARLDGLSRSKGLSSGGLERKIFPF